MYVSACVLALSRNIYLYRRGASTERGSACPIRMTLVVGDVVTVTGGKYDGMRGTIASVSSSGASCKLAIDGVGTTGNIAKKAIINGSSAEAAESEKLQRKPSKRAREEEDEYDMQSPPPKKSRDFREEMRSETVKSYMTPVDGHVIESTGTRAWDRWDCGNKPRRSERMERARDYAILGQSSYRDVHGQPRSVGVAMGDAVNRAILDNGGDDRATSRTLAR